MVFVRVLVVRFAEWSADKSRDHRARCHCVAEPECFALFERYAHGPKPTGEKGADDQ